MVVHSMDQLARQPKFLKDYAPPDYRIETVELDFALDPKATRVKSKLLLRPNPKAAPGDRPLVLDGEGLVLQSIALDGKPLGLDDYRLGEKSLTIPKVPPRSFTLETVTLCDPEANTALSGLYRSRDTYCTQCEPEGFRRIREAYEALRDTESRLALRLFGPPPLANLEELLEAFPAERRYVGPGPWLNVLREPRR